MTKSANLLLILACLVIVFAGLKSASTLVIPFLLAVFIAFISSPLLLWFEQRLHFPRIVSFLIVSMLVVGVLVGIGLIVSSSMDGFLSSVPALQEKLGNSLDKFMLKLQDFGILADTKTLPQSFDPTQIISSVGTFLKSTSKILSNSFLIFLMVSFMLFEAQSLELKLKIISEKRPQNLKTIKTFAKKLNQYLVIKALASFATGVIIAFFLSLMNIKYALVWGVIAFLLNFIPTIGSIIAAFPAILISLVEYDVATAFWVMVVFLVANVFIGNFVEPKFMGKGLGLSALVVFLSLIFWGWVLGFAGMFLAVPLTMSVKMALETNEDTKWIGLLLSNYNKKETDENSSSINK